MKKMICLFISIGLLGILSATTPIEDGNLTVVANSGLKLRTAPTLQSSVVKVIPYGDKVVVQMDTIFNQERIEWMEGDWIYVDHDGDKGYVFDGFLTSLPMPSFDFEYAQEDLMLLPAIDSWVTYRYDIIEEPHIAERENEIKVITQLSEGRKKVEIDTEHYYRMKVYLKDTEMHEAYNLVKSMLQTGYELATFEQRSIFVENQNGEINKISIDLEEPIHIKKINDDEVVLIVTSYHRGCKL